MSYNMDSKGTTKMGGAHEQGVEEKVKSCKKGNRMRTD
jgi:hypothetical protein